MIELGFLCQEKILARLKKNQKNININVFYYEHKLTFPIYIQIKNLKTRWIYYS